MSATMVKICGITDAASALAAAEAGADMIGFHFCPSKRRITPEAARRILSELPRRPTVVGVFIDPSEREVEEVCAQVGLDRVQLHGAEAPGFRAPVDVIKVLKVRDGVLPDASAWPDPVLLDSWSADGRGGTGRTWDWDLAAGFTARRRVIVAGGLDPDNVAEVVRRLRPFGVDVSSGVESAPGTKDPTRVRAFVQAVNQVVRS
ncbi:MAG TPA: phosphoribosylanthranilate isomerase [Candidatus Dormibacteraeota bacterium]|nr:phosphoribosylanthranilate isomerase [Candidatus Dormibacteraeota bacterium]